MSRSNANVELIDLTAGPSVSTAQMVSEFDCSPAVLVQRGPNDELLTEDKEVYYDRRSDVFNPRNKSIGPIDRKNHRELYDFCHRFKNLPGTIFVHPSSTIEEVIQVQIPANTDEKERHRLGIEIFFKIETHHGRLRLLIRPGHVDATSISRSIEHLNDGIKGNPNREYAEYRLQEYKERMLGYCEEFVKKDEEKLAAIEAGIVSIPSHPGYNNFQLECNLCQNIARKVTRCRNCRQIMCKNCMINDNARTGIWDVDNNKSQGCLQNGKLITLPDGTQRNVKRHEEVSSIEKESLLAKFNDVLTMECESGCGKNRMSYSEAERHYHICPERKCKDCGLYGHLETFDVRNNVRRLISFASILGQDYLNRNGANNNECIVSFDKDLDGSITRIVGECNRTIAHLQPMEICAQSCFWNREDRFEKAKKPVDDAISLMENLIVCIRSEASGTNGCGRVSRILSSQYRDVKLIENTLKGIETMLADPNDCRRRSCMLKSNFKTAIRHFKEEMEVFLQILNNNTIGQTGKPNEELMELIQNIRLREISATECVTHLKNLAGLIYIKEAEKCLNIQNRNERTRNRSDRNLAEEITTCKEVIERLEDELATSNSNFTALEEFYQYLEEENTALRLKMFEPVRQTSVTNNCHMGTQTDMEWENDKQKLEKKIDDLRREIAELGQQNADINAEKISLEEKVAAQTTEINEYKLSLRSLQQRNETINDSWDKQSKELKDEIVKFQRKVTQLQHQLASRPAPLQTREALWSALNQSALEKAQKDAAYYKQKLLEAGNIRVAELRVPQIHIIEETPDTSSVSDSLDTHVIPTLKQKIEKQRKRKREMKDENEELKKKHKADCEELIAIKARLEATVAINQELQKDREELKASNIALQSRIEEMNSQLFKIKDDNCKLTAELAVLQINHKKTQENYAKSQTEIIDLKSSLVTLQQDLAVNGQLSKEIEKVTAELLSCKMMLELANEEKNHIKNSFDCQLDQVKNELEVTKEKLNAIKILGEIMAHPSDYKHTGNSFVTVKHYDPSQPIRDIPQPVPDLYEKIKEHALKLYPDADQNVDMVEIRIRIRNQSLNPKDVLQRTGYRTIFNLIPKGLLDRLQTFTFQFSGSKAAAVIDERNTS